MKQTRQQKRALILTIAVAGIALGITAAFLKKKKSRLHHLLDEHEHAIAG